MPDPEWQEVMSCKCGIFRRNMATTDVVLEDLRCHPAPCPVCRTLDTTRFHSFFRRYTYWPHFVEANTNHPRP